MSCAGYMAMHGTVLAGFHMFTGSTCYRGKDHY